MEPTAYNDKYKDRENDKGEEDDKDEDGATVPPLQKHFKHQYSDSENSDSNRDSEKK